MTTRRQFLGLSALAVGAAWQRAHGFSFHPPCVQTGAVSLGSSSPITPLGWSPESIQIAGMPFSAAWTGDDFPTDASIPFHHTENIFPGGRPPEPQEEIDIAIVGGGLSGLASAYMLRERRPVVFELHPKFGGTSQGEMWMGTPFSLGGAYFIAPDEGSSLESLYRELGLHHIKRDAGPDDDPYELNGQIQEGFWQGVGLTPQEQEGFRQYAALVQRYVDQYPEIPLVDGEDNAWILALDQISLRDHIESQLTVPVPTLLKDAIQGYCFSSFGTGWGEISAASGWNFIAAEEYGRWILPGGNAGLVQALWTRLLALERHTRPGCPPQFLRAGCRVVDVRVLGTDRVQVTYRDSLEQWRSLIAKRVVMATPKHIARHVLHKLNTLDPKLAAAMGEIGTHPYVVANVLLAGRIQRNFYDLFLLREGNLPSNEFEINEFNRVIDSVDGGYARPGNPPHSVLTLYWPLPFPTGRFRIIPATAHADFAAAAVPQIRTILDVLNVPHDRVRQVRLSRWGHAMPLARPGLIAQGVCDTLRRPFQSHVFFVNQDNWALPAVETCLLEAEYQAPRVLAGL